MSTAQQLYHLQEIDLDIESGHKNLQVMTGQIGESQALITGRAELDMEKQHLEAIQKQQHSLEWEADDISAKIKVAGDELYSGRIRIPKELSNLQHDIELLKTNRGKIEDKILELMEDVDSRTKKLSGLIKNFGDIERKWRSEQQKLAVDIEQLKSQLSNLEQQRLLFIRSLDQDVIDQYEDLKDKMKTAVARVTQGICSGCRMQLPTTDLHRVRSGNIVHCSSCGRILYLP
jgi:predicted  nucleic acid-binding Zn-ribbon protein